MLQISGKYGRSHFCKTSVKIFARGLLSSIIGFKCRNLSGAGPQAFPCFLYCTIEGISHIIANVKGCGEISDQSSQNQGEF